MLHIEMAIDSHFRSFTVIKGLIPKVTVKLKGEKVELGDTALLREENTV